jgi:HAD superfamily hydrolase (TIGR01509 family)
VSPTLRAVVFDFDGLVLDTETPVYTAWLEAFDAHGAEFTAEEWALEVGTAGALDLEAMLHARATRAVDVDAMHAARRARRDELVSTNRLLPGVEQWIADVRRLHLGVAIASSSPIDWVDGHLVRLGVRDRFDHVSCRDVDVPGKPAPDVYLRACAALGVDPGDALAVEDSPNGIKAAKAAGLRCVAVPNAITAPLDFTEADLVVASLAEVSLAAAADRLGLALGR